ncbi:TapB family protein [Flagellimonas flava]|uniref:TapB family protein n=1 Tax=Flagellimonas flava TaxID=570519 RepID=UPI003D6601C2
MKKAILILLVLGLVYSGGILAQTDCSKYYPVSDGAKFEISLYNNKMKKEGKVVYSVKNDAGDKVLYSMEMYDKKDVLLGDSTYGMHCEEDGVSIDFKSMMGSRMTSQFGDMELDITGNNIYLPNDLEVGKVLPDAEMQITVTGAPVAMNSAIKMVNRTVIGEEEITTPAGTFQCMILAYTSEMKMGITNRGYTKQWLAENVGMVKTEDYNKEGGKLRSISLLTSYQQ